MDFVYLEGAQMNSNGLFTGLAGLQDSTVLKSRFFAPNRHFRGRYRQVRCNLG
jgi:hypothetical protein